jgi:peptide/nickel transport system permease protein
MLKKFFYLSTVLFVISLISFFAIHFAPNSLFNAGELNPNMTKEALSKLKAVYGLDKPLIEQYFEWFSNILKLNFGISFVSGNDVFDEIFKRLPITLFLNGITLLVVFIVSLYLGIKSALNYNNRVDFFIKQFSLFSFSVPSFYLALLFIIFFSVNFEIFPISGLHSLDIDQNSGFTYYLDMLWHLVLPLSVMIFVSLGNMIIYIRSLTLEILKSDYYFFAKSRNLTQKELLFNYILPNLLPPIVTLLGLSLPGLIGGSVILESIFGIDGMGQLFFLSTLSRDYPVIMGILIFSSILTLVGNMVADLILLKLNPYANK